MLKIAKPWLLEQNRNLLNESLLALLGFNNKAVCDWEAILGRQVESQHYTWFLISLFVRSFYLVLLSE